MTTKAGKKSPKVADLVGDDKAVAAVEEPFELEEIPLTSTEMQRVHRTSHKFMSADKKRQSLVQSYRKEKKVPVSIQPMYAAYFGSVANISVNGISVFVPCDGRSYSINATHAAELHETLGRINATIQRQNKMASVQGNHESSPGELKF